MRLLPVSSLVAVAVLVCACASGSDPGSGSSTTRRRSDVISREELEELSSFSAFDAIRLLRPRWLQTRGNANMEGSPLLPTVMVDGAGSGTLEDLHDISVQNVESIRFITGRDATTMYGTGYGGGVIAVTTRRL
jgi:hypothetical protein